MKEVTKLACAVKAIEKCRFTLNALLVGFCLY
jgi:hypothetical protein